MWRDARFLLHAGLFRHLSRGKQTKGMQAGGQSVVQGLSIFLMRQFYIRLRGLGLREDLQGLSFWG
jgi:hypothetical protein